MYKVYKHTNLINGKIYIGITKQEPKKRWQNGKGYKGTMFGNAINKYGWENFKHDIIFDNLTQKEACSLEQLYIRLYRSNNSDYGYNLTIGGEVLSNSCKRSGKENSKSQRVYCYDSNHNFIKEFESQNIAAIELGINRKGITKNCLGISKTYKGYIFEYADKEYSKPVKCERGKHNNHYTKKVNLIDDYGNVIKEFESIIDASKEFDEDKPNGICRCCLGIVNTYHKRRWCYGL